MKQSKLFSKTRKDLSADEVSTNAQLLIRGGFIEKVAAGVYAYLPLGLRVLNKIEKIVREEMDKIGVELYLPSLSTKDHWKKTGRLDSIDVLMKTSPANKVSRAKNSNEYILNPTHEDVITPIAKLFNASYKDLPVAAYQIQTKFRNEPRPKSGLMRGREFRMKDMYSFHVSEENMQKFYEEVKDSYSSIFHRLGLGSDTIIALASGGDFTKDFSHEFQTICEAGEDTIFISKTAGLAYNKEVAPVQAVNTQNPEEPMAERKDVEGVGIVGVQELAEFLKIPTSKTSKTLIYENDNNEIIAAVVWGDYDINEEKLKQVLSCKWVELASEDTVKTVTGADIGYAGILNLPETIKVIIDDSLQGLINFETGGNRTNYHTINVNWGRDLPEPDAWHDIKLAKEGDIEPSSGEPYKVVRAAEVGNIFPLNTKFSDAIDYMFNAEDGARKPVYMASYGIGTTRLMGVLVEKNNDKAGIIWPKQIAPYHVHLIQLKAAEKAEEIYKQLIDAGIEVLFDDRDVSPGQKFNEADLLGMPIRIVVSEKTLATDSAELKLRSEDRTELVKINTLKQKIEGLFNE